MNISKKQAKNIELLYNEVAMIADSTIVISFCDILGIKWERDMKYFFKISSESIEDDAG